MNQVAYNIVNEEMFVHRPDTPNLRHEVTRRVVSGGVVRLIDTNLGKDRTKCEDRLRGSGIQVFSVDSV